MPGDVSLSDRKCLNGGHEWVNNKILDLELNRASILLYLYLILKLILKTKKPQLLTFSSFIISIFHIKIDIEDNKATTPHLLLIYYIDISY